MVQSSPGGRATGSPLRQAAKRIRHDPRQLNAICRQTTYRRLGAAGPHSADPISRGRAPYTTGVAATLNRDLRNRRGALNRRVEDSARTAAGIAIRHPCPCAWFQHRRRSVGWARPGGRRVNAAAATTEEPPPVATRSEGYVCISGVRWAVASGGVGDNDGKLVPPVNVEDLCHSSRWIRGHGPRDVPGKCVAGE